MIKNKRLYVEWVIFFLISILTSFLFMAGMWWNIRVGLMIFSGLYCFRLVFDIINFFEAKKGKDLTRKNFHRISILICFFVFVACFCGLNYVFKEKSISNTKVRVIAHMNQLKTNAFAYKSINNSFLGWHDAGSDGKVVYDSIMNYSQEYKKIDFFERENGFCMAISFLMDDSTYCVDSNGYSGLENNCTKDNIKCLK